MREALTVRERRRVRRDTTVSIGGTDWELDQGFLAGRPDARQKLTGSARQELTT
jgi:hypothetical protein